MYPNDLKYTKSHEWVKVEGDTCKIGITSFAIKQLTDITFLEFSAENGEELGKGEAFGEIESVKSTSELYMPVSGKIVEVNTELEDMLEELMKDPYEKGWMLKVELTEPEDLNELLDTNDYENHAENEEH